MKKTLTVLQIGLVIGCLALVSAGCSKAAKKERLLERADRHYQEGDYEKARIEYMNVLRLDPGQLLATRRLGLIYYDRGDIAAALQLLSKTKQSDPSDLEVRSKLADIYRSAGGLIEARAEALSILQKQPGHEGALVILADTSVTPQQVTETQQQLDALAGGLRSTAGFYLAMGKLHLRQRDFRAALDAFKQALARDSGSSEAFLDLGNVYWAQGKLEQAEGAYKAAAELAPVKSLARLRLADFKIKTGALEQGKKMLQDLTQQAPDFALAWAYLAQIAFVEKNYKECAKLIDATLAQNPTHLEALLLRARLKMNQAEPAQAEQELKELTERYPKSPQVRYQLAVASLLNRNPAHAVESLNKAVQLNPNFFEAAMLLAELKLRRGDTAAAITDLTGLIASRPDIERAYLLLAEAYYARANLDRAAEAYRKAIELFPKNPRAPFSLGLLLRRQNKAAEARAVFENTLKLVPGYVPAVNQLIELDLAEKKIASAYDRVQAEIQRNPKLPGPLALEAKIHLAEKQTEQAIASLQKAIELDDSYLPAYFDLARVFVISGKDQQALEQLREILKSTPNDVASLLLMGMVYERTQNYSNAAKTYERLLEARPGFSPALNNLAYLYVEHLGEPDKAYDLARKARELLPNEPAVADTFGWVLFQRGQYAWALSLFQESAEKLSSEPEVHYHLGMAYYMMGEESAARVAFQKALQLTGEFDRREETERRLWILGFDPSKANAADISTLDKWLSGRPKDFVALLRRGEIHERNRDFKKAEGFYERARQSNPSAVAAVLKLAQLYTRQMGEPQKALNLVKSARNLAPNDPQVAHELAKLAYEQGDYSWSLSLLEVSNDRLPDQPDILFDLAHVYYSLGQLEKAKQVMKRAVEIAPGFKAANTAKWFLLLLDLHGNPSKAMDADSQFPQALQAKPDYSPVLMVSAAIAEHRRQLDQAQKIYEQILSRQPNFIPATKRLAILLSEQNDRKGYELAMKARNALPGDPEVAKALGKLLYQRGEFSSAVPLLQQGSQHQSSDADLLYHLGIAQYKTNSKTESRGTLNRALSIASDHRLAPEARKLLAERN